MTFQTQFISPIFLELNIIRIKPNIYQQINVQLSLLVFLKVATCQFLAIKNYSWWRGCEDCWNDSKGLRVHKLSWWASQVVLVVKNPPAMQEMWVWSLDWADALEKGMATHSSILAWRIPWTEEPGGSIGSQRVGHDWSDLAHTLTFCRPE